MIGIYKGSVPTRCGFRSVEFKAKLSQISAKRLQVVEILEIDGESVGANMSRTGAKRQSFYGHGAARHEEGKIKYLSSVSIIEQSL